ncbi:hypothetical protein [Streptomonospora salina]|uniref:Mrp family chromosome partitioning ATPase n=1 Tax=Streptomonospora salina TaxID=104205 RepID=A0A841EAI7_9ACTN|nr:hypothetical protein [Streptomonospora salina]MBB5998078.1 Mrp family chromosome partitioning ATPase [Streptomonospora salina]
MPLIVVFSLGGAPGVTTASLALAAAWPEPVPSVLVEADASGGDLAAWRRMPTAPGVAELAATARTDESAIAAAAPVLGCAQVLAGGQRVCLAPATADRAAGAIDLLARHPEVLRAPGAVGVVDAGRLAPRSPAAHLAAAADVALLVVADDLAQLKRAQAALPALRTGVEKLGLVVTGARTSDAQVQEELGTPVLQRIPTDPRSAAFLRGESSPARPHRRPLLRSAHRLADELASTAPQASAVEVRRG